LLSFAINAIHNAQLYLQLVYTHQRTGELTEGIVKRIRTNSQNYHRGIKVMLEDNVVGRVQEIK